MSTDEFTEWFLSEHSTGQQDFTSNESDVDSCIEDSYEPDSNQIEPPDFIGGSISIS